MIMLLSFVEYRRDKAASFACRSRARRGRLLPEIESLETRELLSSIPTDGPLGLRLGEHTRRAAATAQDSITVSEEPFTVSNQLPSGTNIDRSIAVIDNIGVQQSFLQFESGVSFQIVPASEGSTTYSLDVLNVPVSAIMYKALPRAGLSSETHVLNTYASRTTWFSSKAIAQNYAEADWHQEPWAVLEAVVTRPLKLVDLGLADTVGFLRRSSSPIRQRKNISWIACRRRRTPGSSAT